MPLPLPFAWDLRKVRHGGEGERFTLRFLECDSPTPPLWVGCGRELTYAEARREALARWISTGAFEEAVERERRRFARVG